MCLTSGGTRGGAGSGTLIAPRSGWRSPWKIGCGSCCCLSTRSRRGPHPKRSSSRGASAAAGGRAAGRSRASASSVDPCRRRRSRRCHALPPAAAVQAGVEQLLLSNETFLRAAADAATACRWAEADHSADEFCFVALLSSSPAFKAIASSASSSQRTPRGPAARGGDLLLWSRPTRSRAATIMYSVSVR